MTTFFNIIELCLVIAVTIVCFGLAVWRSFFLSTVYILLSWSPITIISLIVGVIFITTKIKEKRNKT